MTTQLPAHEVATRGREITGLSIFQNTNDDITTERVEELMSEMHADVPQGGSDFIFGKKTNQRARLWKPEGSSSAKSPVIVFVHGGSWMIGTYLDSIGSAKVSH